MSELRIIAIASELADQVRATMVSPGYGHPVTAKVATGLGPCRHCLQPFAVGEEVRLLFTLNPFDGVASIPQPDGRCGGRARSLGEALLLRSVIGAIWRAAFKSPLAAGTRC